MNSNYSFIFDLDQNTGEKALYLRHWDGYDRPLYIKLFYISRLFQNNSFNEKTLKNFKDFSYFYNKNRDLIHIYFGIKSYSELEKIFYFVDKNYDGEWSLDFLKKEESTNDKNYIFNLLISKNEQGLAFATLFRLSVDVLNISYKFTLGIN